MAKGQGSCWWVLRADLTLTDRSRPRCLWQTIGRGACAGTRSRASSAASLKEGGLRRKQRRFSKSSFRAGCLSRINAQRSSTRTSSRCLKKAKKCRHALTNSAAKAPSRWSWIGIEVLASTKLSSGTSRSMYATTLSFSSGSMLQVL
jgi:hypothetical protein